MPTRLEQFLESEERRRKKIETLLTLLKDPELADVVKKLVEDMPVRTASPLLAVSSNGNGHKSKLPPGASDAIRQIGPDLPHPFTIHDVINKLDQMDYKYPREKKADVVRDAIYFMLRRKNCPFRVVKRGENGALSTYEYGEAET